MEKARLITAKEVSDDLGISIQYAYSIIKQLNKELEEDGCFVIKGKTNRYYYEQRLFGNLEEVEIDEGLK
ncbi:DNA-binding protein [Slackia isoflavoniconvertens]|uniref:DNA-binding protein n=1 Tax=Slackia isoflavoniconvertens TaxID=572010 RepID=UPI003F964F96